MNSLRAFASLVALSFAAAIAGPAHASSPGPAEAVELRGRIDAHMAEKVRRALAGGVREFLINSSNGGFVFAAYSIADMMRSNDVTLTINGMCASACALLAIGVPHKRYTSEAVIELHGARYTVKPPGADDDAPAKAAAAYMMLHGVPEAIATGPGMAYNLHRLSPVELAEMGFEPGH